MAAKKDVLQKIVALKRQIAEQHVHAVQLKVEKIEVSIKSLQTSLKTMDEGKAGIEAHLLAEAHGHVGRVIKDIATRRGELSRAQLELYDAREALKRVFHSQERLGDIAQGK